MIFLAQTLLLWTLAATALGLFFGFLACGDPQKPGVKSWRLLALLVVALATADALARLPGRAGLWLDAGLMVLVGYVLGAGVACATRRLLRSRPSASASAEPPDWLTAAHETLAQAKAFVGAAPQAIGANAIVVQMLGAARLEQPASPAPPLAAAAREPSAAENERSIEAAVADYRAAQAKLRAHGLAPDVGENGADQGLDAGAARVLSASLPQIVGAQANDAFYPGERPLGVFAPPRRCDDDLTRIAGVDEATVQRLQGLGVWTFCQIAAWTADHARWVEAYLAAPGRVERESWREQARALCGQLPGPP